MEVLHVCVQSSMMIDSNVNGDRSINSDPLSPRPPGFGRSCSMGLPRLRRGLAGTCLASHQAEYRNCAYVGLESSLLVN